jgi:hypothetical protein
LPKVENNDADSMTVTIPAQLATNTDVMEYVCVENEKSLQHMK